VLILLPPSEGKSAPTRGRVLDLTTLTAPELTEARAKVLSELSELCAQSPDAAKILGLGTTQQAELTKNARLWQAPTTTAAKLYSGVLYEALGYAHLSSAAKRRANRQVRIFSGAFGLIALTDRLPAYRLSGNTRLPHLGLIPSFWRTPLAQVRELIAGNLVLDLRSQTYAAFWQPPIQSNQVVTLRVLHEVNGARKVVSHFNKAIKGDLVRSILEAGVSGSRSEQLASALGDLGWQVERDAGVTNRFDVIVHDVPTRLPATNLR
jgi:uncharacterized protein